MSNVQSIPPSFALQQAFSYQRHCGAGLLGGVSVRLCASCHNVERPEVKYNDEKYYQTCRLLCKRVVNAVKRVADITQKMLSRGLVESSLSHG